MSVQVEKQEKNMAKLTVDIETAREKTNRNSR